MRIINFFEILTFIVLLFTIITQIIIPCILGQKTFPIFRSKTHIINDIQNEEYKKEEDTLFETLENLRKKRKTQKTNKR